MATSNVGLAPFLRYWRIGGGAARPDDLVAGFGEVLRPPGIATKCGRPGVSRRESLAGRLGIVQSSSGALLLASKVPVSSIYSEEEKIRSRSAGSGLTRGRCLSKASLRRNSVSIALHCPHWCK